MTTKMSFEADFNNLSAEVASLCADEALRMWERSEDMSCYRGPNETPHPWAQSADASMGRGQISLGIIGYWDQ